jgi:hypothetical protein
MKRWLIVVATVGVGAAVVLALMATNSTGQTRGPASQSRLRQPIIAAAMQSKWLPAGPSHLGDTLAVQVAISDSRGHPIGSGDYTCTVVALATDRLECWSTIALTDGSLQTQAEIPRAALESFGVPFETTVVGGTGAYAKARGVFRWTIDRQNVGTGTFISQ